jgi:cytosylglucuronate decarboxylase
MTTRRRRYLFIRILEACNADCFMCAYASSRDGYRFTLQEFEDLLPKAQAVGVSFVRFTGGEPLLHREIIELVRAGRGAGMGMSIITNGALLPSKIEALKEAGLVQIIVSIDGASAATHDFYRNTPGLFDKCIAGLAMARERGVKTRVNTVVGPHNYTEMPTLQKVLSELGIEQWELSALKLERPIVYEDPEQVRAICNGMYAANADKALVPMGKRFYGESEAEQSLFFDSGITPRPSPPQCNLMGDVIYLDAKNGRGFGCSLLPHRSAAASGGGAQLRTESGWRLHSDDFDEHVKHFRILGPTVCTGCSTTAAGYSDHVAQFAHAPDWLF